MVYLSSTAVGMLSIQEIGMSAIYARQFIVSRIPLPIPCFPLQRFCLSQKTMDLACAVMNFMRLKSIAYQDHDYYARDMGHRGWWLCFAHSLNSCHCGALYPFEASAPALTDQSSWRAVLGPFPDESSRSCRSRDPSDTNAQCSTPQLAAKPL